MEMKGNYFQRVVAATWIFCLLDLLSLIQGELGVFHQCTCQWFLLTMSVFTIFFGQTSIVQVLISLSVLTTCQWKNVDETPPEYSNPSLSLLYKLLCYANDMYYRYVSSLSFVLPNTLFVFFITVIPTNWFSKI